MKRAPEGIDLSYRPSRWVRTAAIAAMGVALASGVSAGGNRETQPEADPDAPRTEITVEGDVSTPGEERPEDSQPLILETTRPAWAMVFHPSLATLQTEINQTIESGYAPAGIEIGPDGAATILYEAVGDDQPRQWLLEDYTVETINEEVSARLLQGWHPTGFSVLEGTYFILYATGTEDVVAWRIHQTPLDSEAIPGIIDGYRNRGYEFVDFSIEPSTGEMWYLFLERESSIRNNVPLFVNAYQSGEATVAGVGRDYQAGRGMPDAVASGSQVSFVAFRRVQLIQ